MAGYPITKTDVDNRVGALIVALQGAFDEAITFKQRKLDNDNILSDTILANLGFTPDEITTVRAAFGAIEALYAIARNGALPAGPDNYFFHADKLSGLVV